MAAEEPAYGWLTVPASGTRALLSVGDSPCHLVEDDAHGAFAELEQIAKEMLSTFENLVGAPGLG